LKSSHRHILAIASSLLLMALALSAPTLRADASAAIQAAQHQLNAGNYTAAVSTLQAAQAANPSSAEVCYWLERSYYEMRDWDNAVAQGEKAVSLDPKNSLFHQWLGRSYGGKADRDRSYSDAKKVKAEFTLAVSLDPSNIAARRDLEEYCVEAPWIAGGSKDEALAQVNAIAAIDPIAGHLARALYYRQGMKNTDQAENEMRQVLAASAKSVEPYFEAAEFFRSVNKPADMRAAIDAAAKVNPNDPRLAYYRGAVGVLTNTDLANAERNLKSYLASTPDRSDWPAHASAREWLGNLYEAQGKRTDAAEQYQEALQLHPSNQQRKEVTARLKKLQKS
jgi:tetratricopeptide (TPR) repeat protein